MRKVSDKRATKPCQGCGELFQRRIHPGGTFEMPHVFARRKYCTRACGYKHQMRHFVPPEPKKCFRCDEMIRWEDMRKNASRSEFEKRKFCSHSCRSQFYHFNDPKWNACGKMGKTHKDPRWERAKQIGPILA
jgi:hypothetical protein